MDRPTKKTKISFIIDDADFISRLPREILISILSRLTLKQAAATSVLSRSWEKEKLWTFYHGDLYFNFSWALRSKGCSNYARWMNKVLDTLEHVADGGLLDSFTIHFNQCPDNNGIVDRWVQFALEKRRVKRLVFDSRCISICCTARASYDFPPLKFVIAHQRTIQALTSIYFRRLNVSCEIIEHFLASCPLLETLDLIELLEPLNHLKVSGETLALKHLLIQFCHHLTTIEIISAPNLVSLRYQSRGERIPKFYVGNVPKLVEFTFGSLKYPPLIATALHLLTCFTHIRKFTLRTFSKEPGDMIKLVELPSVEHFTMCILRGACEHVLEWTPLLKAFPYLQQFTLDMSSRSEMKIDRVKTIDDEEDDDKFPSKCLKVFEFLGFGRLDDDIELVLHLLKKMAVRPEKILLQWDDITPSGFRGFIDNERRALCIVEKLKQIIPDDIKLLIHKPRPLFDLQKMFAR